VVNIVVKSNSVLRGLSDKFGLPKKTPHVIHGASNEGSESNGCPVVCGEVRGAKMKEISEAQRQKAGRRR
jgi:hypothetical protein